MSYTLIAMQNIVLAPGKSAQLWNQMLIIAVNDITDQFDKWEQDAEISNDYLSSVICMFQEQVVWQLLSELFLTLEVDQIYLFYCE